VRLALATSGEVEIAEVFANGSAARAQLQPGDVLIRVAGERVTSIPTFQATMKRFAVGERVEYEIRRAGERRVIPVELTEFPREVPATYDVLYSVVSTPRGELRSLVSRPRGAGPFPAVLFIQGVDCSSIERSFAAADPLAQIVEQLTGAGFVVMRVEKSGVGDSTGPPCVETGLAQETDGFLRALRALKASPFVDAENVFLFGASAGGWVAPVIARAEEVRGILGYALTAQPFFEYAIETTRRNARLVPGTDLVALEARMRGITRFLHHLLTEQLDPEEILARHRELAGARKELFPNGDDLLFGYRSVGYFREIAATSWSEAWSALDAPVLAMVGEFDKRTSEEDHRYIADLVNAKHAGHGSWKVLPRMDHGFALHTTREHAAEAEFKGPFGVQVVLESVAWMQKQMLDADGAG
jgi:dienelactone hydrolase